MSKVINALCIDVEHWYCSEYLTKYLPQNKPDQIVESVSALLNLLDKYQTKATFSILGSVAEQHPEVVKEIFTKGHEIACHAYSHTMLNELGEEKTEIEIKKTTEILQSITGQRPIGFRAPSFSIDNNSKWALKILVKYGYKWDASVFPMKTILYGVPNAPFHIYKPSLSDVSKQDPNGDLIEFPMTVYKMCGVKIPVAGGIYLRFLPLWFLKHAFKQINKERPVILYIHPWEIYPDNPRLKNLPLFSKLVTYYGINSGMKKLEGLLKAFRFAPVKDVLGIKL